MIKNWDWGDTWAAMAYVVASGLVTFLAMLLLSDHTPTGYYLERLVGESRGERTCLWNVVPWSPDSQAACFETPLEAAQMMRALQQTDQAPLPAVIVQ